MPKKTNPNKVDYWNEKVKQKDDRLYKNKYVLSFYEKDDDTLKYFCLNIHEVLDILGLPHTRGNYNKVQSDIWRSLQRPDHMTNLFRGQCLKVYITDVTINYEEDLDIIDAYTKEKTK